MTDLFNLDYNYNIYGLDWRCKGVWPLGLLQKVKLPTPIDYLPAIEKFIISLLRVEVISFTLIISIWFVNLYFILFFLIGNFTSYSKNPL